ncbi:MAG TPA: 50S ribosomal protein L13 [Firmicutes bacterium]|nr:50S ribosomal protein L13 [Bacillota bacterium]
MNKNSTYTVKAGDIERKWYVVDATGKTLGRLASQVASILRGKHKPIYTPNMDTGDHVIVVNAEKVAVTGDKLNKKIYYTHSLYPGGLKATRLVDLLKTKPERVIEHAVMGMLPHNRLGRKIIRKLRVYRGPEHPHEAQKPEKLEIEG